MNLQVIPDCLTINGKTLTKPHRNLLAKLQNDYHFDVDSALVAASSIGILRINNRVTGVPSHNLNPLVYALVKFVYECYHNYESSVEGNMSYNGRFVAISLFDRVKYLVLHLDSEAYNDLID